jgi:hypothetical protein
MQLGLGHRALQPEQQPVVEIARRVDPIGIADQRPGQRAQIDQLMPVRRGAREPRDLQRQKQTDVPQADIRDQLLEPQPPVGRGARPAGVLIDDHDRRGRPPQLDRPLTQRVLPRGRLDVALKLAGRGLAHIHHRAALAMTLADLLSATHRDSLHQRREQPREPQRHPHPALDRQRLPHHRRHDDHFRANLQPELPGHHHPRFRRSPRRAADAAGPSTQPNARSTTANQPASRTLPTPARSESEQAGPSTAPEQSPSCHQPAGKSEPSRPPASATPTPPTPRHEAHPARPPAAPARAKHSPHE